jgi:hypothetical protein
MLLLRPGQPGTGRRRRHGELISSPTATITWLGSTLAGEIYRAVALVDVDVAGDVAADRRYDGRTIRQPTVVGSIDVELGRRDEADKLAIGEITVFCRGIPASCDRQPARAIANGLLTNVSPRSSIAARSVCRDEAGRGGVGGCVEAAAGLNRRRIDVAASVRAGSLGWLAQRVGLSLPGGVGPVAMGVERQRHGEEERIVGLAEQLRSIARHRCRRQRGCRRARCPDNPRARWARRPAPRRTRTAGDYG